MLIVGIKYANLGLAFLLELCVLSALGYWGFRAGSGPIAKTALGIGAPFLAVAIWGIFGAPKATIQLHGWSRLILEIVFFGSAVVALWAAGWPSLSVIFAAVVIVNHILIYVLGQ